MQGFCLPHTQGMDPFLSVDDAVCLFCCLFPPRTGGHSPLMALGEQYWGTTFPGEYARQLMVQALYSCSRDLQRPSLCILGRSALFLGCQCPVALATDTSVPFCLSVLHLMARCWATQEGLGCPCSWERDHSAYHGAGFPSCLGRGACTPIWQSFQMRCRPEAQATTWFFRRVL